MFNSRLSFRLNTAFINWNTKQLTVIALEIKANSLIYHDRTVITSYI